MILEKTVQKKAMNYLVGYYNNRWFRRKIFAAEEVRTKRKFGGKRADGLLVFQSWLTGSPFVVSLEAKSIKTLPAIKPYADFRRWLRNSLRVGILCCLGSGLVFAYGQAQFDIDFIILVSFCLLTGLSFGLLTWHSWRHQSIDVITQLKQYPANEQWLAFSKDAFAALTKEKQKLLKQICQYRGIGLLLIGKNNRTSILSKPKNRKAWYWETRGGLKWISDFLVYYSREKEIRTFI